MTLKESIKNIRSRLAHVVGEREAYWMSRDIIEEVMGYSEVDMLLKADEVLSDYVERHIDAITTRVEGGEPLQQVLGWARFAGNRFKVTKDTLIPRPETQELVDMIIARHGESKDLRVMDVGTGSGCIAISLARGLKFAQVSAIDISPEALTVAHDNAKSLRTQVDFECRDALSLQSRGGECYDIIVSNPPYIVESERVGMECRVLDHEPLSALFVPDDDALLFYRAIARWGREVLRKGGYIYYEINPLFADEMKVMMREMGYDNIEIVKDMQARDRMLCARWAND